MNTQSISNDNLNTFEGNKFPNISNNNHSTQGMSKLPRDISTLSELVRRCRNSRKLVLMVVFIALFFDNMLLTTVGKEEAFFFLISN